MGSILVTGGCGFIGSHTCIELLLNGYRVIILDSLVNSSGETIQKIKEIVSTTDNKVSENLKFINADLRDTEHLSNIFLNEKNRGNKIEGVIHFAGLKSVYESIINPIEYWDVNVGGSISLLKVLRANNCRVLLFSSSATIYGMSAKSPINEDQEIKPITPYGETKATIEKMLDNYYISSEGTNSTISLRYFNPIGAHHTGLIGENPKGMANNIFPIINKVAFGKIKELKIFGNDWDSDDGTGVRDFIHVMDLADGHVKALDYLFKNRSVNLKINLGTGKGTSVLSLVKAYQRVNNIRLSYSIAEKRKGDRGVVYADNSLAKKLLKWSPKRTIDDMCRDGFLWQKNNPNGYI